MEYLKGKTYNELCFELMDGTLQKTLLPKLKKVYPLSFCDLRVFETKEVDKVNLDDAMKAGVPVVEGTEEDLQATSEETTEGSRTKDKEEEEQEK